MLKTGIQTLEEFRTDGRKFQELRKMDIKLGIDNSVDGSSYLKIGLNEVICLIKGPYPMKNYDFKSKKPNLLKVEYSVAPFSSVERRKTSKFDKEWSEFSENLRFCFEKLICSENYSKSQIMIIVSVLQSDGSTKSAIFNAVSLALLDAGIEMKDFMISTTVGILENKIINDLTYDEQKSCNAELVISYLPRTNKIDFMELKCQKITKQEYLDLIEQALKICKSMFDEIKAVALNNCLRKLLYGR